MAFWFGKNYAKFWQHYIWEKTNFIVILIDMAAGIDTFSIVFPESTSERLGKISKNELAKLEAGVTADFDHLLADLSVHCEQQDEKRKEPYVQELTQKQQALELIETQLELSQQKLQRYTQLGVELGQLGQQADDDGSQLGQLNVPPLAVELYEKIPSGLQRRFPGELGGRLQQASELYARSRARTQRSKEIQSERKEIDAPSVQLSLQNLAQKQARLQAEIGELHAQIEATVSFEQVADEQIIVQYNEHFGQLLDLYKSNVESLLHESMQSVLGEVIEGQDNQTRQLINDSLGISIDYISSIHASELGRKLNKLSMQKLGIALPLRQQYQFVTQLSNQLSTDGTQTYDDQACIVRTRVAGMVLKICKSAELVGEGALVDSLKHQLKGTITRSRSLGYSEYIRSEEQRELHVIAQLCNTLDQEDHQLLIDQVSELLSTPITDKNQRKKIASVWQELGSIDTPLSKLLQTNESVQQHEAYLQLRSLLVAAGVEYGYSVADTIVQNSSAGGEKVIWINEVGNLVIGDECLRQIINSDSVSDWVLQQIAVSNGSIRQKVKSDQYELDGEEKQGDQINYSFQQSNLSKIFTELYTYYESGHSQVAKLILQVLSAHPELIIVHTDRLRISYDFLQYCSTPNVIEWMKDASLLETEGDNATKIDALELAWIKLVADSEKGNATIDRVQLRRILTEISHDGGQGSIVGRLKKIDAMAELSGMTLPPKQLYRALFRESSPRLIDLSALNLSEISDEQFIQLISYGFFDQQEIISADLTEGLRSAIKSIKYSAHGLQCEVDATLIQRLVKTSNLTHKVLSLVDEKRLIVDSNEQVPHLIVAERLRSIFDAVLDQSTSRHAVFSVIQHINQQLQETDSSVIKIPPAALSGLRTKKAWALLSALKEADMLDVTEIPNTLQELEHVVPENLFESIALNCLGITRDGRDWYDEEETKGISIKGRVISVDVHNLRSNLVKKLRAHQSAIEAAGFVMNFVHQKETDEEATERDVSVNKLATSLEKGGLITTADTDTSVEDVAELFTRLSTESGLKITLSQDTVVVNGNEKVYWALFFAGQMYWPLLQNTEHWKQYGLEIIITEPASFQGDPTQRERIFTSNFPGYRSRDYFSSISVDTTGEMPTWLHDSYYRSASENAVKSLKEKKKLRHINFGLASECPFDLDKGIDKPRLHILEILQEQVESTADEQLGWFYVELLKKYDAFPDFQSAISIDEAATPPIIKIDGSIIRALMQSSEDHRRFRDRADFFLMCIKVARTPIITPGLNVFFDSSALPVGAIDSLTQLEKLIYTFSENDNATGSYFFTSLQGLLQQPDWIDHIGQFLAKFDFTKNKIACTKEWLDEECVILASGDSAGPYRLASFLKTIDRNNLEISGLSLQEKDFFDFLRLLATYGAMDSIKSLVSSWKSGPNNPALVNFSKLVTRKGGGVSGEGVWILSPQGFASFGETSEIFNLFGDLVELGKLQISTQDILRFLSENRRSSENQVSKRGLALLESLSDLPVIEVVTELIKLNSKIAQFSDEILDAVKTAPTLMNNPEERVVFYKFLFDLSNQRNIGEESIKFFISMLKSHPSLLGNEALLSNYARLEAIGKTENGGSTVERVIAEFPQLYTGTDWQINNTREFLGKYVLSDKRLQDSTKPEGVNEVFRIVKTLSKIENSHQSQAFTRAFLQGSIDINLLDKVVASSSLHPHHEALLRKPDYFFTSDEAITQLNELISKLSKNEGAATKLIAAISEGKLSLSRLSQIVDRLIVLPVGYIQHMITAQNKVAGLFYLTTDDGLAFVEECNTSSDSVKGLKLLELVTANALLPQTNASEDEIVLQNRERARELLKAERLSKIQPLMLQYPRAFLFSDKAMDQDYDMVTQAFESDEQKACLGSVCVAIQNETLTAEQAAELPSILPSLINQKRLSSFNLGIRIVRHLDNPAINNPKLDQLGNISTLSTDEQNDTKIGTAFTKAYGSPKNNNYIFDVAKEQMGDAEIFATQPLALNESNWMQLMLLFMMVEEDDNSIQLKAEQVVALKTLFEDTASKDYCLKRVKKTWMAVLETSHSGGEASLSALTAARAMDEFGGPGPLKHIGAILQFHEQLVASSQSMTTVGRTKEELYASLLVLEKRFEKDGWSDDDRSYFYGLSTDLLSASPSIYADFVKGLSSGDGNTKERFTPKELKQFAREILPLYQARYALISNTDGHTVAHPIRELAQVRRDIRGFFEECKNAGSERGEVFEQHRGELLSGIKKFFVEKYGITKIPENLDSEAVRTIQNIAKYLANIAKNGDRATEQRHELTLALFLALKINGLWEAFRTGQEIDLDTIFTAEKADKLRPILADHTSSQVITSEALQLSTEQLATMQSVLQAETENVHLSNVTTIDEKLSAVISGLRGLADQDALESVEEKHFLAIYQKHGSEVVNRSLALAFQQLAGKSVQVTSDLEAAIGDLKAYCQDNGMEWTQASIKQIQESMQHIGIIVSLISSVEKEDADKHLDELRETLIPTTEVIDIFNRLGEGFQPGSGVYALSQDLNYLQNVIVKHQHELSDQERHLLEDYLSNVQNKMSSLEGILARITAKFAKLSKSDKIVKGSLLFEKVDEVKRIIDMQGMAQEVTTKITADINVIIENMRACLGPSRKEINNDTTLTFGDGNKFFIISQAESKRGSFADQIVFLEPFKVNEGESEMGFIMDQIYGTATPEVLANHVRVLLKKLRSIKGAIGRCPVTVVVSDAALSRCSAGSTGEHLLAKLKEDHELDGYNVTHQDGITVDIKPSSLADHYVEFDRNSSGRKSGIASIGGLVLRLL